MINTVQNLYYSHHSPVLTSVLTATEQQAVEYGFDRMYIKVERENYAARRLYDQLGYRLVYLQPAGWTPKEGATDTRLFLRKDL